MRSRGDVAPPAGRTRPTVQRPLAAIDGAELDPPIERVAHVVGAEADDDLLARRRPRSAMRVSRLLFSRSRVCLTSEARRCESARLAAASPVRLVWPTTFMQVSRTPTCERHLAQPDRVLRLQVGRGEQRRLPGLKKILIGSFLLSRPMPTIRPKVSVASFFRPVFQPVEVEAVEDAQVVGVGERLRPRGTGDRPRPACSRRRPACASATIAEAGRRSRYAGIDAVAGRAALARLDVGDGACGRAPRSGCRGRAASARPTTVVSVARSTRLATSLPVRRSISTRQMRKASAFSSRRPWC